MNWISVKDRLPEDILECAHEYVLVHSTDGEGHLFNIAHRYNKKDDPSVLEWTFDYDQNVGYWDCGPCWEMNPDKITHWMPLPNPPMEETGNEATFIHPSKLDPTSRSLMNEEFDQLRPAFGVSEKLCGKVED